MYHVYGAYNDSIMYSLYTGNWCVDIAVLSASSAPLEHYTTLSQWTIDDKNVSPISVCLIWKLIHILRVSLAFLHNCKYYTGMHAHERGRSNWIDSRYMPSQRSRWRCMVNWPVERISALHDCHTVTVLNEWLHKMNMHPASWICWRKLRGMVYPADTIDHLLLECSRKNIRRTIRNKCQELVQSIAPFSQIQGLWRQVVKTVGGEIY